jgi:hypothetical protein
MQNGQNQADIHAFKGNNWANTVGGVADALGGYFQRREQNKAQQALDLATSEGQYPSATKPVPGSESDVPDPAQDHVKAILGRVSPELRPQVEKGIAEFHAAAAKSKEARRVADQHAKDAVAVGAFQTKGFLNGEDGGLGATMVFLQQAKAAGMDTRQYEGMVAGAHDMFARLGNDPAARFQFAEQFRSQVGPLLDQMTIGASPEIAEKFKTKAPEGFSLSPGQTRFGPDGRPIANVPEAPKEPTPFNLGPGDVRYDGKGNVVASRPAAPKEEGGALTAIMGPDGNPVLVPRSQAVGKRPASTREQGRPVTSGDAGRIAELDTALDEANTLAGKLTGNKATGVSAKVGTMVPDVVTEFTGWGADAKAKEGTINLVKQIIGKGLEGGVLRKEDETKYAKILPTISDSQEVVAAKIDGLWATLQQKRQNQLDSLSDAGYDTSKFGARPPRERKAAGLSPMTTHGQYSVKAPDGKTYRFGSAAELDGFKKRAGIR